MPGTVALSQWVRLCGQGALYLTVSSSRGPQDLSEGGAKARRRNGDISVDLHRARIRRPVLRDDAVAAGRFALRSARSRRRGRTSPPHPPGVYPRRRAGGSGPEPWTKPARPRRRAAARRGGPCFAHGTIPSAISKPEFRLPITTNTLAHFVAPRGLPGLDVMWDVLDTGNRHLPAGSVSADRKHSRPCTGTRRPT